ncbi:hypothetical protein DFQ28_011398 [Apophysomyces sp. BC1034]|nr:hypothetical protein DFQ30_004389 [Apophysomyces sp. BC1015]KAG0172861.1 hypothetical protein DFQ29_008205 [Apophysomyces sp. BC1021]KAG0191638.1 hypothetical protein DFQ28_011398 [Apophysomyces sp. BC1034]
MISKHKSPIHHIYARRVSKNKKTSAIILLGLAILVCLARWRLTLHSISDEAEEKYLAYLPHSGLSNQRIELANALLLAGLLRRTLIIPPALLGTVTGWARHGALVRYLEWLTVPKDFEGLCKSPTHGNLSTYLVRSRCNGYVGFGAIAWSELHDFSQLSPHVPIRFQTIVSVDHLRNELKLNPEDVYIYNDEQLYDWRLYEDQKHAQELLQQKRNYFDSFTGRQFYKVFTIQHWRERKERLLYLGGIFGSTRMQVVSPESVALRNLISSTLQYRLDTPLGDTVKSIVNWLGGKGTFMSIHFRTRDPPFSKHLSHNLQNFIQTMTQYTGSSADDETQTCVNVPANRDIPISTIGSQVRVYIATDHRNPRGDDSTLLPWFDRFPCTITLNDLPEEIFAPLDQLHDLIEPRKSLRSRLIPLVDAMVAAHGREILTTPRSTFSKYIGELHKTWVP